MQSVVSGAPEGEITPVAPSEASFSAGYQAFEGTGIHWTVSPGTQAVTAAFDFESWKAGILERIEATSFGAAKWIGFDDLAQRALSGASAPAAPSQTDTTPASETALQDDLGFVDHVPFEQLVSLAPPSGPQPVAAFESGSDKIVLFGWQAMPNLAVDGAGPSGDSATLRYDSASGVLTFDSNGDAAGGETVIATLTAHTPLSASDFLLT